MRKIHYSAETEKEEILTQAKKNGWTLKEDAITIHGKYLIFDVKIIEKVERLQDENANMLLKLAEMEVEIDV